MLLDLCPELCERIVGELHDDNAALRSLAITARVLKAPAQHTLFNAVTLTGCNYEAFVLGLLAHPYLAPLVRDLTIDGGAVPSPLTTRPEALSALLSFLPSLQNLTIDGLSWMLAHSNTSVLFAALYPSVERITLRNSCVDFATSLRALLSSFPNVKSLEMDGSGAVCSGYLVPGSEERKLDGLESVVLKGKCEMAGEVVGPLMPEGLKKMDVEVCDRKTLDMLSRVCAMSEELEELVIELKDGGSVLGELTLEDVNLSSNSNLKTLHVRGIDLAGQHPGSRAEFWLVNLLSSCPNDEVGDVCYGITVIQPDDLVNVIWSQVDQVVKEKSLGVRGKTTHAEVHVSAQVGDADDAEKTKAVEEMMKVVLQGTSFIGRVL